MGYLGIYDLRLYCDNPKCEMNTICSVARQENHHEIPGQDRGDAFRMARKRGWSININKDCVVEGSGYSLCPKCSGKKK